MNQKKLASRVLAVSNIISATGRSGSGRSLFSSKWIIDNILGGRRIMRMAKIEKILGQFDV